MKAVSKGLIGAKRLADRNGMGYDEMSACSGRGMVPRAGRWYVIRVHRVTRSEGAAAAAAFSAARGRRRAAG